MRVALDSQTISYYVSATGPGYHPRADAQPEVALQRVATVRLLMRLEPTPFVTPTALKECQLMRNSNLRRRHFDAMAYQFQDIEEQCLDSEWIRLRADELAASHPDLDDCRIVAECEAATIDVLATFDARLINRLHDKTRVRLLTPEDCLTCVGHVDNRWRPADTNPLAAASWWR